MNPEGRDAETTEPPGPTQLGDLLCFAVYATNHAFGRAYRPLLQGTGLTYPQYLAMLTLWAEDGQTVGAIGRRLFLQTSTLTPLLKRLERLGYVTRARAASDERQVVVRLTERGQALREATRGLTERLDAIMGLDRESSARLRAELSGLRERLLSSAG